jgi:tryptophan 2,3-dioxygenase
MKYPPIGYHDYLRLEQVLTAQSLRSEQFKKPAHDEMLFIIVHQAYELWFKQILTELGSILNVMKNPRVPEEAMGTVLQRLDRIYQIQKLINGQIDILETMTPLDFLDFRDYLYPASGFQSFQWRCIETRLGLTAEQRLQFNDSPFYKSLPAHQQQEMLQIMQEPSLIECVDQWLSRTPFLENKSYNFWKEYEKAVLSLLDEDIQVVQTHPHLSEGEKARSLGIMDQTRKTAQLFFDPEEYQKLRDQGTFRLSYRAINAALFIQAYRDRPALQAPFKLLHTLMDIDEKMTEWRYKHVLMVQRMLGRKIGTGGSSGADYLRAATEKHSVFRDFSSLASFLIPRSKIPLLPKEIEVQMNFDFLS